jgi:hypothetical protein
MRQLDNNEGVAGVKTIGRFLAGSLLIVLSVMGLSSFHKNLLRLTGGHAKMTASERKGTLGRTKS